MPSISPTRMMARCRLPIRAGTFCSVIIPSRHDKHVRYICKIHLYAACIKREARMDTGAEADATRRSSSGVDLTDPVLAEIGTAMFQLRRLWARPDLMRKIREQTPGSR